MEKCDAFVKSYRKIFPHFITQEKFEAAKRLLPDFLIPIKGCKCAVVGVREIQSGMHGMIVDRGVLPAHFKHSVSC